MINHVEWLKRYGYYGVVQYHGKIYLACLLYDRTRFNQYVMYSLKKDIWDIFNKDLKFPKFKYLSFVGYFNDSTIEN